MNDFGNLLNKIMAERRLAIQSAERRLWQRHNLSAGQQGYYIDQQERTLPNGETFTELRLYKLIDAAVILVESEARGVIKGGIAELHDQHTDKTHPFYVKDQPDPWGGLTDDGKPATDEDHKVSEG